MEPRIETLLTKKLIGKRQKMSFSDNKTFELWQSFMRQRKELKNVVSTDLISMQVFGDSPLGSNDFTLDTLFEKWAAAEVADFEELPAAMETYILQGGLYAVFLHRGAASAFQKTYQYIFGEWLPKSPYELDNREQFEILGDKYKNNDPSSEEEIWIPIRAKV
jgi:AraC family transcriptional regulator